MWQGQDEVELDNSEQQELFKKHDSVIIRGSGNLTVFGLCNRYNDGFPSALTAKVAPEEFAETVNKVNRECRKCLRASLKALVLGCLCCCCSCGLAILPSILLNHRARRQINKVLAWENTRVYHKIGLNWSLCKTQCERSSMVEYVLMIEPIRRLQILAIDWGSHT